MIDDVDVLRELDEQIVRDATDLAQQALAAGWHPDELAVILRPWLEKVARTRAQALARLHIDRADWHVASVH